MLKVQIIIIIMVIHLSYCLGKNYSDMKSWQIEQIDDSTLYVTFQTLSYVTAKMLLSLSSFYPQLCALRRSQATSSQVFTSRIW